MILNFRVLVLVSIICFGLTALANDWPHPDDLDCEKAGEAEQVCEVYRWCIYQGQLMGSYEMSYLKSTCAKRSMEQFDLDDQELFSILKSSL